MLQGPPVPPRAIVIVRHPHTAQPSVTPPVVIVAPPPPPAVVVVAPPPPPVMQVPARHGVRVVHHHDHASAPGLPRLVGVHKPRHVHHTRTMMAAHTHGTPILPGHTHARAQQPSLRASAAAHAPGAHHAAHPTHVSGVPVAKRVIHK